MFGITDHKGFQITFANGYTIRCEFGCGNYCERQYKGSIGAERDMYMVRSKDCEVAIWENENPRELITGEICDAANLDISNDMEFPDIGSLYQGDVAGWVTPDDVAKLIAYISSL